MPVAGLPGRERRELASSLAPGSERLAPVPSLVPAASLGSARREPVPREPVCGLAAALGPLASVSFPVSGWALPVRG